MSHKAKEPYLIPAAKRDVAAALAWYEEQSIGLGVEFLRCLEATLSLIQRYPLMYPAIFDDSRRALIRRFPYAVIYEIEPTRVVIYAVFHCSQDPDKWKARLR